MHTRCGTVTEIFEREGPKSEGGAKIKGRARRSQIYIFSSSLVSRLGWRREREEKRRENTRNEYHPSCHSHLKTRNQNQKRNTKRDSQRPHLCILHLLSPVLAPLVLSVPQNLAHAPPLPACVSLPSSFPLSFLLAISSQFPHFLVSFSPHTCPIRPRSPIPQLLRLWW
ncbi:uncharacterized protein K452DRAFT_69334 [Aplosporella prunicola CBS 121167]|uniref:Uncharacterized protein n=1 Tax=Aplosporella prunicola CBS 121167 TaxID=1176127 RepID=A0A6A6BRH5_9PEZI|nr:uncharacterized protein K452DRAFT_69334 [Aplosporella prunicola CBS 121167]KAF2146686.1 hypothetical protein K452DRAFT_69334 [Aplosporella prunicola CBS 121167]